MNCAICGKDNQAGTRFCVHCGAALTAPAGGSQRSTIETAGAILGPKRAPASGGASASTATAAAATASGTTPVYTPRPASPPPPPPETTLIPPDVEPAPAVPAYNAEPKRAGWVLIAIAVAGAVAIGGSFGYYRLARGPLDAKDTLTRSEATPQPAPTAAAQPTPTPATAVAEAPRSVPETPAAAQTVPPSPPAEKPPSVAPPKAEPKTPRAVAAGQSASRQQPVPPPIAAPMPPAPAPQPPVRTAQQATSVAAAAPVPDHWAQFAEDLHRCERESFLSRVVCDQRVRLRYCDGYWGKVAQCPGGMPNPDRGQ